MSPLDITLQPMRAAKALTMGERREMRLKTPVVIRWVLSAGTSIHGATLNRSDHQYVTGGESISVLEALSKGVYFWLRTPGDSLLACVYTSAAPESTVGNGTDIPG
ncbi:MAG: hypothetical protein AAGG44_08420 [Planctomycetota bacterium]